MRLGTWPAKAATCATKPQTWPADSLVRVIREERVRAFEERD